MDNLFQREYKSKNKNNTLYYVETKQKMTKNHSASILTRNFPLNQTNKPTPNPSIYLSDLNNSNHADFLRNILNKNEQIRKSSIIKRNTAVNNVINKMTDSKLVVKKQINNFLSSNDHKIMFTENNLSKVNNLLNSYKTQFHRQSSLSTPNSQLRTNQQEYQSKIKIQQNINKNQRQRNIHTANNNKKPLTTNSSTGKLHRGKNTAPQFILPKQQRLNPFYQQPQVITQKMINTQGIYNLLSIGVLPKQYDFAELLNTKYELMEEKNQIDFLKSSEIMKIQSNEGFMTNPGIISQYEQHRRIYEAELKLSQEPQNQQQKQQIQLSKTKIRKSKTKKGKKVKNNSLNKIIDLFPVQIASLTINNGAIQKCVAYQNYYKNCLMEGNDIEFLLLSSKMQQFAKKYNLKRFKFKPQLAFVRIYSDKYLLSMIENSQLLGINKAIKPKQLRINSVLLRAVQMNKFRILKKCLSQIQKLKKYFRFKKLYYQTIDRRYDFFKYKLGSFTQQQRKFIQKYPISDECSQNYVSKIQIHILSMETSYNEEKTYYKLRQRLRSQMTRIFNMQVSDIIILADPQIIGYVRNQMELLVKMADKMSVRFQKIHNKRPNIHIFQTILSGYNISQTARTYFGIGEQIIKFVHNLCHNQKPVIIPYQSSRYLPLICELFNANLFGGTYTKETIQIVFEDDQIEELNSSPQISSSEKSLKKFVKLEEKHSYMDKIKKLQKFQLANKIYENKRKTHEIFKKFNKLVPLRITLEDKNDSEFYNQLAKMLVEHKQSTKWILKLPYSTFSRGIAILEINDLKIFQEKHKKTILTEQDIQQVSRLLPDILKNKIIVSHSNLFERKQYLQQFFSNSDSFIEQYLENSQKICVFGKILPNGKFIFMGSYKKIYCSNLIGFGASYPAQVVKPQMIKSLQKISKSISDENVFGYITFEFLYHQTSSKFYYLDFIPNLDEYSSFYFFYDALFRSQNMNSSYLGFNRLSQNIFYCPFLDNNGNKFQDIQSFLEECHHKRIQYNSITQQGQKFIFLNNDPSVLSVISLASSEFLAMKGAIEAIAFLVENGEKFNQFDKKYLVGKQLKMDGLYVMDIIWKLREIKKKNQSKRIKSKLLNK